MPPADDVGRWLRFADAAPEPSWRAVELAGLDPSVRAHSALWCGDHLVPDAFPYLPGRDSRLDASAATVKTPDSPPRIDLLRHRFDLAGFPLELIEGRNFTFVRISALKALQGSTEARAAEIQRMSRLLLAHPWTFRLPTALEEGVRFSSNPDVLPDETASWTERGDGGIRAGKLWFLCTRRMPHVVGFSNDQQWFPAEFRSGLGAP
jgi:hypothetical protein